MSVSRTWRCLGAALGASLCAAGAAQAEPQLRVQPAEVRQGQQVRVEVIPDGAAAPLSVSLAGQKVRLFAHQDRYVCFLALPADQKPGGYTLQIQSAGQNLLSQKIEVLPVRFATQAIRFYRPALTAAQQKVLDEEEAQATAARQSRTETPLWQGAFNLPVPHRISSTYGIYRYLNGKYNGFHGGVDFASPMGYPVKAPAAAKVTLARYFSKPNSNGNTVFLDHGLGVTSAYIHFSKIAVTEGQMVKQGDTIGYIGSTGRSTGPHLHWGMYLNGQNTDGLGWVRLTQQAAGQP
ncbi:MAG: M23 family metallopeptidase [Candidatus Sericytochromatia bacterium]